MNGTFQECFKKIRITNKTNPKCESEDEVQKCLELKSKFISFVQSAKSPLSRQFTENTIQILEAKILKLSAAKNSKFIKDQIGQLKTLEGSFSQTGMWKIRSKLCPRKVDPPMAKKDEDGNLITSQEALKKLYINTYTNRLKHRQMKDEFQGMVDLKNILWNECFIQMRRKISSP